MAKRHKIKFSTSAQIRDGKAGDIRYNPWGNPELALKGITGIQRVEGATPVPVRVGVTYALYWFVGGTEDQHFVPYNPQVGQADALIYAGFSFNADSTQALLNGTKWRISDIPFTLQTPVTFPIPQIGEVGLFRADIIHVDYNGQAHYTVGTAGATAVAPDLPYKHILVTTIYVSLEVTTENPAPVEYPDVQLRQGTGNPIQSLGIAGDSYLNTINGEVWFKTLLVDGVATWEKKYTPVSGIPAGGTARQIFTKIDGTDFNAGWAHESIEVCLVCSDETSNLIAGAAKATTHFPFPIQIISVFAEVATVATGAPIVVDINEAGNSILSTKLSIDVSEETSATAAIPAVISDVTIAAYAKVTIDIDQVGAVAAGKGLKVYLRAIKI